MTPEYENRGVLFINKRKQTSNQPDWTGTITIDGKKDRLSAWGKRGSNGEEYISISRTPADEAAKYAKPKAPETTKEQGDDIPF
jgi:hypothetical protein